MPEQTNLNVSLTPRFMNLLRDRVTSALDEARINTLPLWDVDKINGSVRSITRSAQQARAMLGGGQ